MSEYTRIAINAEDSPSAVILHAQQEESQLIEFAIPEGARFFSESVNLDLLKTTAEKNNKTIRIVTNDQQGLEMARYLGIDAQENQDDNEDQSETASPNADNAENESESEKESASDEMPQYDITDLEAPIQTKPSTAKPDYASTPISTPTPTPVGSMDIGTNSKGLQEHKINRIDIESMKSADDDGPVGPAREQTPAEIKSEMAAMAHDKISLAKPSEGAGEQKTKKVKTGGLFGLGGTFGKPSPKDKPAPQPADRDKELDTFLHTKGASQAKPPKQSRGGAGQITKIALAVLVVAGLGWAYWFLPSATVKVLSKRQEVVFDLSVIVDKNISKVSVEDRKIPGQIIFVEKTSESTVDTTGQEDVNSKAHAVITAYNEQLFAQSMIPSRFEASNGQIYWSQKSITIPAAKQDGDDVVPGTIDVEVFADKAGEAYNRICGETDACEFTVPAWKGTSKFELVYARGTNEFVGGKIGVSKIVTQADIDSAQAGVSDVIKQEALDELQAKIPSNFELVEESIETELSDIELSHSLGDPTDTITARANATARAILINPADLNEIIHTTVSSEVGDEKIAHADTIITTVNTSNVDIEQGTTELTVEAKEEVGWKFDEAGLIRQLAGKSDVEVRRLFGEMERVQEAQITLWPFWVKSVPRGVNRITLTIE